MAEENKIKVPDIGGATNVDVIEILVNEGDEIDTDTPLITLESEKASMDIPSPKAGKVKEIQVKAGDKVSEGDLILTLEGQEAKSSKEDKSTEKKTEKDIESGKKSTPSEQQEETHEKTEIKEVRIPDIGGATDVDVIEIMVQSGDKISKDQALITLEGDKATMDIPAPCAGVVDKISMNVGDKVSQGDLILTLQVKTDKKVEIEASEETENKKKEKEEKLPTTETKSEAVKAPVQEKEEAVMLPAGPAVRKIAREFGVDLGKVKGTGRKSRITKEDIQNYVKQKLSEKTTATGVSLPPAPQIDFSKYGEIDIKPLNKIKRLTGINVHRSWINIPHVTQFDEADITELESFRKTEQEKAKKAGYKLTVLAFVCKVVSKALKEFPQFNTSLDESGENLIYKKYFNIGIAVETENGLVVPVIRDVGQLSVADIAKEMARLSSKARDKGLMPVEMSGGCFTISSLGGIGGTAFTPIVNGPEVAILGLSRSSVKPVYDGDKFAPRLMLPLSLSYDHRVIDGAEAARFTRYIAETLGDIRRVLL
ncbi:dihydrolipoyllysine-residue acetyltransferase [Legionella israelensis]|uniref:Acetyltransferase component of pyruvate dehydrogenase complex n=1 Tax=Legionella israelensis TaxID=454 RepID=A0A0W0W332_9GAMM|nr:dihydrolipoyllysine-residue acetyltransferase [Legionella israelensis]KTD26848.1 pyruvate dehydrogenase E2 component [Legionella israelensis]QBS08517.1 dihydrolipoyllysine-residue acetyltransferase [Legionella israelensis]SCX76815.1 pyruvate dehydrogenase E2 component (dihydrolipoamide acetyltransferase) [Legionella israelensis DSM 19235]STX58166.1 pyruvate dehydrogenase E2 component [Legionella israelensis]